VISALGCAWRANPQRGRVSGIIFSETTRRRCAATNARIAPGRAAAGLETVFTIFSPDQRKTLRLPCGKRSRRGERAKALVTLIAAPRTVGAKGAARGETDPEHDDVNLEELDEINAPTPLLLFGT